MLVELPNAFGDTATNMAIDSALLQTVPSKVAIFRHYGWLEPATTFGFSQRFEEVRTATPEGVQLCRRLTGGGIVDHRDDWTYALIFNTELPVAHSPANTLYEQVHRGLASALEKQLITNQLAPCPRKCGDSPQPATSPDVCFVKPVANDVIQPDGQKIAGAAMKRNRSGLLLQGSVDRSVLPEDFDYAQFQTEFLVELSSLLDMEIAGNKDLRPLFNGPKIAEEKARFESVDWLKRR